MRVRFWGTRGSIASPGPGTARYGGNTSCVEIRVADGTVIVLDCGTGARGLGLHLLNTMPQPMRLHLFIGHTHWDHIQGFPFFVPAFLPGAELNVYAPLGFQRSLQEAMSGQMEYSYFPVKLRDLRSRIHFTDLEEGFFRIGDVLVEAQYLNHTAPTLAYRLSSGGTSVAYTTDHEPFWKPAGRSFRHPGDQRHIAFLKGADLVIHDAQYSEEEYANRVGWGHSTIEYATDVALAAGAGRLALFHHDPTHDDAALDRLQAVARERAAAAGGGLDVFAAAEGLELELQGGRGAAPVADVSALRRRLIAGARVLVVSGNDREIAAIEEVLAEDGLVALSLPDGPAAVTRGPALTPDLAIIDGDVVDGGSAIIQPLRNGVGRSDFPVLLLAEGAEVAADQQGVAAPTDYLSKPFSPPMLRARVRAWLARTLLEPATRASDAPAAAPAAVAPGDSGERLAGLLASVPLFRALSTEQIAQLVAEATEQVFPAGHVVIRQGEMPEHLYVMLSGRVRVVEATPDGQTELLLGELGQAEVFGELAILRDQRRSATVIAVERTHCVVVRQEDFLRVLEGSASLAGGLVKVLAARLYDADRRLARYAPDPLTGVASRRALHDQYVRYAAVARRRKHGVLLLVLDVFELRTINDRFGYATGDEVLRTTADALMDSTRATDLVARYGGDEFAVILLEAAVKDVDVVAARVRDRLAEFSRRRRLPLVVEVSLGVAFSETPPETLDELLREADRDLRQRRRGAGGAELAS